MNIPLPFSKLALDLIDHDGKDKTYVVLVATASFNLPTFMHLCLFEMQCVFWLTRDALNSEGLCVIGGYMSPVNDAYNKRELDSITRGEDLLSAATCKTRQTNHIIEECRTTHLEIIYKISYSFNDSNESIHKLRDEIVSLLFSFFLILSF
ncbi:hypothetical protein UlMin_038427 [Ulmus minor]